MLDFLELLERFNRKERFFLVLNAIGQERLTLSAEFRKKLGDEVGVTVPDDAYAAMDYHLDWLAASVRAYSDGLTEEELPGKVFPNHGNQQTVKGSIEDIDLLIAFENEGVHHVILVEAKAYASWTSAQLKSKGKRLERIFSEGAQGNRKPIKSHFCLLSPKKPQRLSAKAKSYWPHCIRLDVPDNRLKVTRTNKNGSSTDEGDHFKIERA